MFWRTETGRAPSDGCYIGESKVFETGGRFLVRKLLFRNVPAEKICCEYVGDSRASETGTPKPELGNEENSNSVWHPVIRCAARLSHCLWVSTESPGLKADSVSCVHRACKHLKSNQRKRTMSAERQLSLGLRAVSLGAAFAVELAVDHQPIRFLFCDQQ